MSEHGGERGTGFEQPIASREVFDWLSSDEPDACPYCGHLLRSHRIERPVYDSRAVFSCRGCKCRIDGTTAPLSGGNPNPGAPDE